MPTSWLNGHGENPLRINRCWTRDTNCFADFWMLIPRFSSSSIANRRSTGIAFRLSGQCRCLRTRAMSYRSVRLCAKDLARTSTAMKWRSICRFRWRHGRKPSDCFRHGTCFPGDGKSAGLIRAGLCSGHVLVEPEESGFKQRLLSALPDDCCRKLVDKRVVDQDAGSELLQHLALAHSDQMPSEFIWRLSNLAYDCCSHMGVSFGFYELSELSKRCAEEAGKELKKFDPSMLKKLTRS